MKYKRKVMIIVIVAIIFIIFAFLETTYKENIYNNVIEKQNEEKTINEIKQEMNLDTDTKMYEVIEEYDGRKIIQIKPEIQFDTVLAGIIKNGKPEEEEIAELIKKVPQKNGIWISDNSVELVRKLLMDNQISNYNIDDEGYLKVFEENSNEDNTKLLSELSNNINNLIIIDISGKNYSRDEITGKIIEYPFEDMDPDQISNIYFKQSSKIIELTTNKNNKITPKEILEEIILNIS